MDNRIIPGLFMFKKDHHMFEIVSKDEFYSILESLPYTLNINDRLSYLQLINYYVPVEHMALLRIMGCNTLHVAYQSQGVYFAHEAIIRIHASKSVLKKKGLKFPST